MSWPRILIVKDDPACGSDLHAALATLDYTIVATVTAGQAAEWLAGETPPDLVLIDVPSDTLALEAAHVLVAHIGHRIPAVRVVATPDAPASVPDTCLVRPFTLRELRLTLELALQAHRLVGPPTHAERTETEEALHESERRIRELAANIPGAVYQFRIRKDGSFAVPFMSQGGVDLFELPLARLMDESHLFEEVHPDDVDPFRASIADAAQNLHQWAHEFRILTSQGKLKWLRGSSNPRPRPDGSLLWDGVLLDITERKHAEAALRDSEERYRRLAKENAILVDEVNHRVGNNLALLQGLVVWATDAATTLEAQKVLLDLRVRIESMARVHQMLNARAWADLDLRDLLRPVVDGVLAAMAVPYQHRCKLELPPNPVPIAAKPAFKLALILNELTTNSLKHARPTSRAGSITVKLDVDGPWVDLVFADCGPGWPEDVLAGRKRNIGLSLVYAVIEQEMGGAVTLSNQGGAVAALRFPGSAPVGEGG